MLVDVALEIRERKCVALLVLSIALALYLETLVSQVDEIVLVLEVVIRWARPHVAFFVEIYPVVIGYERPDSDVKLSSKVQKGLLDILLNDPISVVMVSLVYKLVNFSHILKNLDSTPLIHRSRLDQPHVLSAVFIGNAFFIWAAPRQLPKTMHEYIDGIVLNISSDHKRRRSGVKNSVSGFSCI